MIEPNRRHRVPLAPSVQQFSSLRCLSSTTDKDH